MIDDDVLALDARVKEEQKALTRLKAAMGEVVVGQEYLVDRLIVGLLANGHVLVEGVPGLAKTLSVRTLGESIAASFQRLQFTPDLLPADLVGTLIYNPQEGTFSTKKGPIFANIVLADEINRAPAKVQSALLEAMEERQVTIGEETHRLPDPFLVLATQNPIEQEGTYPLPEAQIDRFMLKLWVTYPDKQEELQILDRMASTRPPRPSGAVLTTADILRLRNLTDEIYVDDKIKAYIIDLVFATREPTKYNLDLARYLQYGASPRATLSLTLASRAYALLQGRGYVIPQDVKSIGPDVLRHRVIVTYEAEAEELTADAVLQTIFDGVPVP